MSAADTMAEKTPSQTVRFSEPPPDVVQSVQVVQALTAMPINETPVTGARIFFSEPPPDVTQGVQVVATASSTVGPLTATPASELATTEAKLCGQDVGKFQQIIHDSVTVPLNQNQNDSLISFASNVGVNNFQKSTLLRLLNQGDYGAVPMEMRKWTKVSQDGKLVDLPGLVRRRDAEAELFQRLAPATAQSLSDSARERGQAVYKKLFGEKRKSKPDDTALDDFTIEHLFADVWSRPNLEMRQRSMITVAMLAALGRDRELERHIEGALHLGITHDEIIEIMIHVAHYGGWAAGHNGQRIAQEVSRSRRPAPLAASIVPSTASQNPRRIT